MVKSWEGCGKGASAGRRGALRERRTHCHEARVGGRLVLFVDKVGDCHSSDVGAGLWFVAKREGGVCRAPLHPRGGWREGVRKSEGEAPEWKKK